MLQNSKGFTKFLQDFSNVSNSKPTLIHFHPFKGTTMIQWYYLSFHRLLGLIIIFLPKENYMNKFSKDQIRNHIPK